MMSEKTNIKRDLSFDLMWR